jgi:hypothetical protein
MDRNEWRKSAGMTGQASEGYIDQQMTEARQNPTLSDTAYGDFTDLMNRAGRVGIRRT